MTRQCSSCGGFCGKFRCERENVKPEPMSIISIIQQLWDIIDDIDTYGDMAKADDKLYRALVERRQKDRWKTGITTDGQTLNVPPYTAPRQWQGLTPSEITAIELSLRQYHDGDRYDLSLADFANAIEAKLKAKNA